MKLDAIPVVAVSAPGRQPALSGNAPVVIREIAQKFKAIRDTHGGESILYFGGANQGSHLGGTYGDSTQKALGVQYRSNALAQEKTGEAWVNGRMVWNGEQLVGTPNGRRLEFDR